MNPMNYEEAVEYIHSCLLFGSKKNGLSNITELLGRMGNPQNQYPALHVAGTNGKGSTSAMLNSIMRVAGFTTGLYTSPYLERFSERFRVNTLPIADDVLAAEATKVRDYAHAMMRDGWVHITQFEMNTAIGFDWFAQAGVNMGIIEVGLGGRLDSTNVIVPKVSAIANIGLDHTNVLGDTLPQIAFEKAGIVKPGVPCVLYPNPDCVRDVVRDICAQRNAPLYDLHDAQITIHSTGLSGSAFSLQYKDIVINDLFVPLIGEHQVYNAALAAVTAYVSGYATVNQIREGIKTAQWAGRMEMLCQNPIVLLDGAHNQQGAEMLAKAVQRYLPGKKIKLVCGMLSRKDSNAMLEEFVKITTDIIATQPTYHGALQSATLAQMVLEKTGRSVPNYDACVEASLAALAQNDAEVYVFAGSLYIIGEIRPVIMEHLRNA